MATGRANERDSIPMPAPTAWPMLFAAGICLAFAGLVTNAVVSLAGAALFAVAGAGWLREVLPQQRLEEIALRPAAERAQPVRRSTVVVEHLEVGRDGHRMRLPVEVHPWSAGLRGGLLGAGVMALLAVGFGLLGHSSPWYRPARQPSRPSILRPSPSRARSTSPPPSWSDCSMRSSCR